MKVLVTGADGFIGSHLCQFLLKDNHEIIAISRNFKQLPKLISNLDKIDFNQIDVTDFLSLSKIIIKHEPDIIIHLAGQTSHKQSFENPMYDVDVNTKSTLCILETIKQSKLKTRFILGSTFIVVGKPEILPVNEDTPCNPSTVYGINRLSSEYFCKVYHKMYDIDTISFRITNAFGPREQYLTPTKNALNYLIYQAYKGKDITIYDEGNFFRDVIFVSDVISGIKTIMNNGLSGNLYWISSNKKTWFYEIGQLLEELTSGNLKYVESPSYNTKVDVGNFVVDNSKLQSIGWNPEISIKDGIEQTLNYFKSNPL
jgi:nucleoside-diphosphate-sugar epimerase